VDLRLLVTKNRCAFSSSSSHVLSDHLLFSQVLEAELLEFHEQMSRQLGVELLYQQDGAAAHRAKTTKEWLQRHNIKTFPHPSKSPDVSPIEPLWRIFKRNIRERITIPCTYEELEAAAYDAWDAITQEEVAHQFHMQNRMQMLIYNHGGPTKY
jgi:hypothetical protein